MMDAVVDGGREGGGARVVGEYVLGPRIGSGSFAVVYRATHRTLAVEVAVKEIDRKRLSRKVNDSLVKEIAILNQIDHPNIVRFHQSIETVDKIYLVLEYCVGGDLAGYIQRYGRVSQAVARHFMRQLASGLQVLRENNLIHRDLKPQNLLLSTRDEIPVLKIGDFGFARYLTPQGLADTLCGSPLYMAPEIIQNQKYDAQADLWSVGAILFQLVTGKPPFDGNSQFHLFQNILTSTGLKFPKGILEELHPDCVDLCRSLLRQNPVERLTFEEFFNHRFMLADEVPYSLPSSNQSEDLSDEQRPFASEAPRHPDAEVPFSTLDIVSQLEPCIRNEKNIFVQKRESQTKDSYTKGKSTDHRKLIGDSDTSSSSGKAGVATAVMDMRHSGIVSDSLELIEREYVIVNAQFSSMETLSSSLETSVIGGSAKEIGGLNKKHDNAATLMHNHLEPPSLLDFRVSRIQEFVPLEKISQMSSEQKEMLRKSSLHPSVRLHLLHQYIEALSDLAQDKLQRGMHLDSFSVKLVVLATWKEALRLCHSWMDSIRETGSIETNKDSFDQQSNEAIPDVESVNFDSPISVCSWAQKGFLSAFDQAEKISNYIRPIDGAVEMPDAMDIIFQTALLTGKSGAVDELMRNKKNATSLYTKATTLLAFILEEAPYLPLTPPFSLSVTDRQRVHRYILALRAHQNRSEMADESAASNATMLSSQNEKKISWLLVMKIANADETKHQF